MSASQWKFYKFKGNTLNHIINVALNCWDVQRAIVGTETVIKHIFTIKSLKSNHRYKKNEWWKISTFSKLLERSWNSVYEVCCVVELPAKICHRCSWTVIFVTVAKSQPVYKFVWIFGAVKPECHSGVYFYTAPWAPTLMCQRS
jgi:hypothetical protein